MITLDAVQDSNSRYSLSPAVLQTRITLFAFVFATQLNFPVKLSLTTATGHREHHQWENSCFVAF
jgi:hypothetical protein